MSYELCRHIKTNGIRCKSPALSGEFWCYFHHRLHFRHRTTLKAKPVLPPSALTMPVLEDRESIQVAISLVAGAIATGHLDEKRTLALLKILTLANRNVGKDGDIITSPLPSNTVRAYMPTLDGRDLAPRRMSDDSTPPVTAPSPAQLDPAQLDPD